MSPESALHAVLREGPELALGHRLHGNSSGPCTANEATAVWLEQPAWLQDLLAGGLRVAHPHSATPGFAQRRALLRLGQDVNQLNDLQARHDRVRARNSWNDRARNGLRVPSRQPADPVVLHAQVRSAVHEVHGDRVVLAKDALPDEAPAVRRVHRGNRPDEALRVGGHAWHLLSLQQIRAGGSASRSRSRATLHSFVEWQRPWRRSPLLPQVL
mmetsp:Transcript_123559/g.357301  ORF Transcript_123559/g.357301 Transcript_123559/m.357301 type:complete len:214 (+) Transcript_123559:425-1066(+)